MKLTLLSVLTMCVLNSILIMFLCLLFKSRKVMQRIEPGCMIVVLLAAVVRMLFPFEFSYTHKVFIQDVLTPFMDGFIYVLVTKPIEIKVWHVLMAVLGAGAVISLLYKLYSYKKISRFVSWLPKESLEQFCRKYHLNPEEYQDVAKLKVIYNKEYGSPYLVGVRNPCLILPEADYGDEQIHYIALHEIMHVRNKDILWKIVIDVLCTVFWWNPVLKYLKRELFQLIEMRNDMQIAANLSAKEQIQYMECLRDTAVQLSGRDIAFGVGFSRSDFKELKKRMELLANNRAYCRLYEIILSLAVGILIVVSTSVVIMPYSYKEAEKEGYITPVTDENTFLIKNGELYDVYVDGKYLYTTDEIEPFYNVNIYNDAKEVEER